MKKFAALLFVAVMVLCAAACSSSKQASELSIATSPDFPPFESYGDNNEVVGIEIEICNIICEKLGMTLKINEMPFDSVLPGVQAGKFDMGVSGISVTEDRKKNTLFTDPYCLAAQAIVVVKDSPIASKADLDGKTVSVQTATTAETYCMENGYTVSSFEANSDAQLALVEGKVDAWVIDDLTAAEMVEAYNASNPGALVILDEAMTTEPYAFAFKLGNEELVNKINEVLKTIVSDGTVKGIFEKYNAPYTSPMN